MASKSKVILMIVSVFDIIAFALAVAAEQHKKQYHVVTSKSTETSYCDYESDIATGYGVVALLFLMASQVLIMVVSRCLCLGKALSPSRSRTWSIVMFISCWVTFSIAESCLLAGSVMNAKHTTYSPQSGCYVMKSGVFGTGAAFALLTGICTVHYYICYSKATDALGPDFGRETGVVMGRL